MKTLSLAIISLLLFVLSLAEQKEQKPYDIILRDDQEPFMVSVQSENKTFGVMSCDEYGFGGPGVKIEKSGCTTQITFDFGWHNDFSYHPRKKPDVIVAIKSGDNLHGEFIVDTCGKTAAGFIRDDNQNLTL
ncbi:MAG: hypothetical protein M3362_19900, partial [Acidobacteriota bacterium]|nr:hypothetical protein [Acidobacteriota bacterium]